jgi:cytochrome c-type biogenesis protein CcmH/NrfG
MWLMPRQPKEARIKAATIKPGETGELERAISLINGSDPMKGILMLRDMVEKDSTNTEALSYLGLYSLQTGQLDKARERFEEIVKVDSLHAQAHWQLGQLDFDNEEYGKAILHFEKVALYHSEEIPGAWFFLGRCRELTGDFAGALEAYTTFKPLNTDTVVAGRLEEFMAGLKEKLNK